MKNYTYQDWLDGKLVFSKDSGHSIATSEIGLGTSLEDFNLSVRNTPSWLHDEEGILSTADYRKIKEACFEAVKAVLEYFEAQIPDFINDSLDKAVDRQVYINDRIIHLKSIIEENENSISPVNYDYSSMISGAAYADWKSSNDIKQIISAFEDKNKTGQLTKITHPFYLRSAIEIHLVKSELLQLKRKKASFELNETTIFNRYKSLVRSEGLTEPAAFNKLIDWLYNEYGFDEDRDKKRYDIAVTPGALKRRLLRDTSQ